MSETDAGPRVLEFGRYRVFEQEDGGWVLARAAGTCDRCQSCGCGEQADPIHIPGLVVKMAVDGRGAGMMARLMGRKGGGGD